MAGSGKTQTAKELRKVFPEVQLRDEINLSANGMHDDLKAQARLATQKTLATGNDESYEGRSRHSVLENRAEVFRFRLPDDGELKNKILAPILNAHLDECAGGLIIAFHLIRRYNPTREYNLRDLEMLAYRLLAVLKTQAFTPKILETVCIAHFGTGIAEEKRQNLFLSALQRNFAPGLVFPTKDQERNARMLKFASDHYIVLLAKDRVIYLEKLRQNLEMRERALATGSPYQKFMLLEGEPGLNKSTIYKYCLEMHGFVPAYLATPETPLDKIYYEVSAGDKTARDIVMQAVRTGAAVILDEINADPSIELFLNKLYDGEAPDGEQLPNTKWLLCASSNSSHGEGLSPIGPALGSRMDITYVRANRDIDLTNYAAVSEIPYPEQLSRAFNYVKKIQGSHVNTRTFFGAVRQLQYAHEVEEEKSESVARPASSRIN